MEKSVLNVSGNEIRIVKTGQVDYISLTDIAKIKEASPADVIKNWIRNRITLEFLGTWEQLNNPDFKVVEFDYFE